MNKLHVHELVLLRPLVVLLVIRRDTRIKFEIIGEIITSYNLPVDFHLRVSYASKNQVTQPPNCLCIPTTQEIETPSSYHVLESLFTKISSARFVIALP